MAAANCSREVLVSQNDTFAVDNHHFTRFSIIPSVALIIVISEKFEGGSWYKRKVLVGLKDAVFQLSLPQHHACEINSAFLRTITVTTLLLI